MTLQPLTSEAIALNVFPEIDYPDSDSNPMADNTEQDRNDQRKLRDPVCRESYFLFWSGSNY